MKAECLICSDRIIQGNNGFYDSLCPECYQELNNYTVDAWNGRRLVEDGGNWNGVLDNGVKILESFTE